MADSAVQDPPAPPPATTSFADKFNAAMEQNKTTEPVKAKGEDKTKQPEPKKKGALDVAIEGKKPETATTTTVPDNDADAFLKDHPEDAKNVNWSRARKLIETQKTLIGELTKSKTDTESRLGEYKDYGDIKTKAERAAAIEAENKELREAITAINVEYEPGFRSKYVEGRQKLLDKAVARVKEYGGNVDLFNDALAQTGKTRTATLKEALTDVDELDRPRIISVLDQVQALDDERADLQKDPQKAWETLQARQSEQNRTNAEKEARRKEDAFERIVMAIADDNPTLRTVDDTTEGAADWNQPIKEALTKGKALFLGNGEIETKDLILASIYRYDYPRISKMLLDTYSELQTAKQRLAEIDAAQPDFRGGKGPAATAATANQPEKKRSEVYQDALRNIEQGVANE
jgi:hypothetical protein